MSNVKKVKIDDLLNKDIKDIEDPIIVEYVLDYKRISEEMKKDTETLKDYITDLQTKTVELQRKISGAHSNKNYIIEKINKRLSNLEEGKQC